MEVKKEKEVKVPVTLADANGNPVTGKAFSAMTVYLQKQGGASVQKALVLADWVEIDATNFPGVYDLRLSIADTDTAGFLKYAAATAGAEVFVGILEVVERLEADTYKVIANRHKIDTAAKTFTIFDSDGTTPILVFDLKDENGVANATRIFERLPQ